MCRVFFRSRSGCIKPEKKVYAFLSIYVDESKNGETGNSVKHTVSAAKGTRIPCKTACCFLEIELS